MRMNPFLDWLRRLTPSRDSAPRDFGSTRSVRGTLERAPDSGVVQSVQTAIVDHLEWCRAFSERLAAHSMLPGQPLPQPLPDAMESKLGQWIHQAHQQGSFGRHPAFVALQEEHARFHLLAEKAMGLARANRMDQASTLLNTEFERSRVRVIELLRVIQRG